MHRVGRILDAAVVGSDDETRRSFDRDYDHRLYHEHSLPPATPPVAVRTRRRPLVFRLTLRRKRFGQIRERHTILSFFDTAGEDLTTTENVELNVRYLSSADGIILLLDPLQMPGARALIEKYALVLPKVVEQHDLSEAARLMDWRPAVGFVEFLRDLAMRDERGEDVRFLVVPGALPSRA
jgi:hypothetical protein